MNITLTPDDCRTIATSLDYTIQAFRDYAGYPSREYKLQRINDIEVIRQKVHSLRMELETGNNEK